MACTRTHTHIYIYVCIIIDYCLRFREKGCFSGRFWEWKSLAMGRCNVGWCNPDHGEWRTALARDHPLALRSVERTALFLPQWKSVVLKSHGGGGGSGGSTHEWWTGEIYRRGDDIGCCGVGTVAVGNRLDAIMCKARAFTIRARVCIYIYYYIRCGGGRRRRIHYFASGTKSRDGKRSFILSLYSFYFLPT